MTFKLLRSSAVVLVALLLSHGAMAQSAPAPKAAPAAKKPAAAKKARVPLLIEQRALDVIKAASDKLAAANSMSFTAIVDVEYPSKLGPPLAFPVRYDVAMQRPDKLRVLQSGAGASNEFYYDGKTMMAYSPDADLVAVASAPPTIDAALQQAYQSAAIYFPFTDVLVSDPYADLAPTLKKVFYIGQSKVVGGTTTDVIGIVTNDLFGQMWIGAEDHLPRAYRVTYLDDPQRLRQSVVFSKWELDGKVDGGAFGSAKAAAAKQIAFARPDPQVPQALLDAMKAKNAAQPAKKKSK